MKFKNLIRELLIYCTIFGVTHWEQIVFQLQKLGAFQVTILLFYFIVDAAVKL